MRPTDIDQVFYGSETGDRDYRVLAASQAVRLHERDVISTWSRLGGSATQDPKTPPIFSFYELDEARTRFAFSRTLVRDFQARGRYDYLVHALILDEGTLDELRGDVFTLAGQFVDVIPPVSVIDPKHVDLEPLRLASTRNLGADLALGRNPTSLVHLLSSLRETPTLVVLVSHGDIGTRLCRDLLSVLPPDDRKRFSFCSRLSPTNSLRPRFGAFVEADRPLVEMHIAGGPGKLADTPDAKVVSWLESIQGGVPPVLGLSVSGADDWHVVARRIMEFARGEGSQDDAASKSASSIALHVRNIRLPQLSAQAARVAAIRVLWAANDAIRLGRREELIAISTLDRALLSTAQILEVLRRKPLTPARALAEVAILVANGRDEDILLFLESRSRHLTGETSGQVLRALLQAPASLVVPFVSSWIVRWRDLAGPSVIGTLAHALRGGLDDEKTQLLVHVLDECAPAEPEGRRIWFHQLVRLSSNVEFRSRVALVEGLADEVEPADLARGWGALLPRVPQLFTEDRVLGLSDSRFSVLMNCVGAHLVPTIPGELRADDQRSQRVAQFVKGFVVSASARSRRHLDNAFSVLHTCRLRLGTFPSALGDALDFILRQAPQGLTGPAVREAVLSAPAGYRLGLGRRELAPAVAQAFSDATRRARPGAGWVALIWVAALTRLARSPANLGTRR